MTIAISPNEVSQHVTLKSTLTQTICIEKCSNISFYVAYRTKSLVEQVLLNLPKHSGFSGVRLQCSV